MGKLWDADVARSIARKYSIPAGLFLLTLFIFLRSPVSYFGDSKCSLLLSENLLKKRSFVLDDLIPHERLSKHETTYLDGDIYQIEVKNGHFYYYFPPGGSILAIPFVAVGDLLGWSVVKADHTYDPRSEDNLERWIASFLMAILTVIFYYSSRLILPAGWSVCIALGGALGTQVWSTASRSLWTHTWGLMLISGAIYLLLLQETGRRKLSPVLLASLVSWMYFVRPTNSVFVLGITVYLLLFHRALFVAYALTGAAWLAGFVAYSWSHFHTLLPSYFQGSRLGGNRFWEAFGGTLISPSRGLLICVPITLFILYLIARYWRRCTHRRVIGLALAIIAEQWLIFGNYVAWPAGVCFGARFTTELVPLFVVLAILGIAAMLQARREDITHAHNLEWYATLAVGGFLLLLSVFINGRGANSLATVRWNIYPMPIDSNPSRVWSWQYPQGLAGITPPQPPDPFPKLDAHRVTFGNGGGKAFLYDGWAADSDSLFCWSDGHAATLIFALDDPNATGLRIVLRPHLFGGIKTERVEVELNGREIAAFSDDSLDPRELVLPLPQAALRPKNYIVIHLPDAISPESAGEGPDPRCLGIALYGMELIGPAPAAATGKTPHP